MPRGDAELTRARLLDAGTALAARRALSELRVDDVVAHAGVAKGTFYLHFRDRTAFLVALHRRFHDAVKAEVENKVANRTPGLARLMAGSLAYLDACRRDHPIKALLIEARVEPNIQTEVARQNGHFAGLAEREFAAAGWPAPAQAARLWIGMVAEAALAEAEANRRNALLRGALKRFLGR